MRAAMVLLAGVLAVVGPAAVREPLEQRRIDVATITEPVTYSVMARSNRTQGTYTTASAEVPNNCGSVGIKDNATDGVMSDPANTFLLTLFVSPDGVAWRAVHREAWSGGTHWDKNLQAEVPNHIDMAIGVDPSWWGQRVRAELDLPKSTRIGFAVTVYPVEVGG